MIGIIAIAICCDLVVAIAVTVVTYQAIIKKEMKLPVGFDVVGSRN